MGDVGATLRSERERLGIGIDRIEAETHIRAKFLLAIEEERFGVLPGPAYVRAFVRDYAEQLGLDPQALMAELSTHPDMAEEPVTIAPRREASIPLLSGGTRSAAWTLALVAALVIVIAAFVVFLR
jgi:cytoskeleton protein RodZ